jgi:hypothetical protein
LFGKISFREWFTFSLFGSVLVCLLYKDYTILHGQIGNEKDRLSSPILVGLKIKASWDEVSLWVNKLPKPTIAIYPQKQLVELVNLPLKSNVETQKNRGWKIWSHIGVQARLESLCPPSIRAFRR